MEMKMPKSNLKLVEPNEQPESESKRPRRTPRRIKERPRKTKHTADFPRGTLYHADPDDLVIIGLDDIDDESTLNDERLDLPLDPDLLDDIMQYGIQENTVGRKNRATGKIEMVDGRQRVRCAREANRRFNEMGERPITVPVVLVEGDDDLMFELQIVLNRRVESTPLMQARTAQRYLMRVKSKKLVCQLFRISEATLENWFTLIQMAPEVHEAIDSKQISSHQALQFAKLTRPRQKEAVKQLIALGPKQRRTKQPKKTQEGEPAAKMPSKMELLNLVVKGQGSDQIDQGFILGLKYALGMVGVDDVPGLKELKDAK